MSTGNTIIAEDRYNVYFCNPPSMQVIDGKGQPMVFISGRFVTKDPAQIAQLESMCENGSGAIFKNPDQLTLAASDLDPMNALRNQFYKEFQAEQARRLDPTQNFGSTALERLTPASTTDIAPVTAGNGPVNAASLAALTAAVTKQPQIIKPGN